MSSAMRSAMRSSSDRRSVTCVVSPVASSTINPTPERLSKENGATSFVTPSARSAGAVSRTFAMISSRVISIERPSLRGFPPVPEAAVELAHQLLGGFGDHGAGREDRRGARLAHRLVILRRDDAADHDHDVGAALLVE